MATNLYVRSVYSLLSSMCSVEGIISSCLKYGYKSCAVVDKNVLQGAMNFKKAAEKNGIKPIYGLETELSYKDRAYPIVLYAKNDDGFKNLMGLSSHISTNLLNNIDADILNRYKPNNFLLFMSDNSPVTISFDRGEDCDSCLKEMRETFGDFMVGLADHNINANFNRDRKLKLILKRNDVKTIALSRTFYLNKEDAYEYEVLKCIRDKEIIREERTLEEGRHFLSIDEFHDLYDEDDLKNSDVLASLCNVKMDFKTTLPDFKTPNNASSREYLVSLANAGLNIRLKNKVGKAYRERLDYELSIINRMHFDNYFLIVYDFIKYAKKKGIYVGPGRGSGAGSLVCYSLGITDIDPLKYGLLFERFLNPERISMPDIDTDFPDDRRDEVVEYVKERYGEDHVAHIITYGTLKAKQVLRDVGRVLNYSPRELDAITKPIPQDPHITLDIAYNNIPLFRQRIDSSENYRKLFAVSRKLEGLPRHTSTHAAGIVFSKAKLDEVIPITRIESDINSTQYTMEHLEEMGLIKMDFLGLRNLGIIAEICEDIKARSNPDFNIKTIPLNDEKTFKLIDDVNLLGVFQLESNGMQNLARKMKPRSFEELSMMIALFRPGPMENIPEFLANRADKENIRYLLEELKPILEDTYGIIVYQEQIMTIARVIAGFSYGKADILRKAMSKKKLEELVKLHDEFIGGCIKHGHDKQIAEELYNLILKFANYGFNKSHSIAYGLVAYQMAYLKANYPLYFYKALLNGVIGANEKTFDYIKECRKIGITILAPSINDSDGIYKIINNSIMMPFGVIKDLGTISIEKILKERENGEFKDYIDTVCRLTVAGVDKIGIENMINAGAFDNLGHSRFTMLEALENVLKYASTHKKEINILSTIDDKPIIEEKHDNKVVLAEKEKNVLGFYFSYNPILEYKLEHHIDVTSIADILNVNGYVKGFGLIKKFREHKTKRGDIMCFVDIYDDTASISLAVMPETYKQYRELIDKDRYIVFEGKLDQKESVLVKRLMEVK